MSGHDAAQESDRGRRPNLSQLGRAAMEQITELVQHPSEGVIAVRRDDDGWVVTIEVLEMERIPETSDVLASYEVNTDDEGQVRGYRRVRRYTRASTEEV